MEKHGAFYRWFWYRPLFRGLRYRILTMVLALVLPVSLVCLALSAVSVYQSRESAYMMNQNALSFYLDQVALRHELGAVDILSDFPASVSSSLTLLYWNAQGQGTRNNNGGSVYASLDGDKVYKILPDGTWEEADESFEQLKRARYVFVWDKEGKPFRALVAFPYDFSMRYIPVWFWIAGLISLTTIASCPLLYSRLKRNILNPMQTMSEGIDAFQQDRSYRIPRQSLTVSDDFLHLFDHFNTMAAEVESVHAKEMKLIETEMENLRLQVNPHMLLNSYNMIYALAESKNYTVIQDYTLCLVDYFRYVLRRGQQQVTVRQELEFVENFIRIQRIRFPGRFSYVYQADDDAMSAQIPPLLIENFVENAVKYALDPTKPIEIVVSVRKEADDAGKDKLHIAITDTGSGIRPEVLEKLKAREPYIDEAGHKHIGIYNCFRRIELFYGEEGDIHFSSGQNQGTQIYLIVPYMLPAEEKEAQA